MSRKAQATPLGDERPQDSLRAPFIPLWEGRGKQQYTFLLLNERPFGVHTHWDGHRILPCTIARGKCLPCSQKWDRRWRGFAGGLSCRTKGRYLLQITAFAWRECPELAAFDGELRGRQFNVRRLGDQAQAPWVWSYARFATVAPPVLSNLWGIDLAALAALPDFNGDVRPLLRQWTRSERGSK
jgi:hypothetical protein